jgi:hypothetical protein
MKFLIRDLRIRKSILRYLVRFLLVPVAAFNVCMGGRSIPVPL